MVFALWTFLKAGVAVNREFPDSQTAPRADRDRGAIIWAPQTRQGVGFPISKIATNLPHARNDSSKAIQVRRLYNRNARLV